MKTKIATILSASVLMLGAVACSEQWNPPTEQEGTLSLGSLELSVKEETKVINNAAGRAAVDVSQFLVNIYEAPKTEGDAPKYSYVYASMPEVLALPVGKYTVEVESHHIEKAAWEAPYYCGSLDFEIEANKIKDLGTVECKFASIKVTVAFADDLRKVLGDDVKVTIVCNDLGRLEYTPDETRAGYFEAVNNSPTLIAKFTGTINGNYTSVDTPFKDVEAGQWRIITYKIKNGPEPPEQTGGVNPGGVNLDISVGEVDVDGNVNITEDPSNTEDSPWGPEEPKDPNIPDNPDDPKDEGKIELKSEQFPEFDKVYDVAGWEAGAPAVVLISADNLIADVKVKIESETLTSEVLEGVGLVSEFSLANDSHLFPAFEGLGFPYGDGVNKQASIEFKITDFMGLLGIYGSALHKFHITVTDMKGNVKSETLQLQS